MPAGASVVEPADDAERAAYQLFLDWVHDLIANARANAARAEQARSTCA